MTKQARTESDVLAGDLAINRDIYPSGRYLEDGADGDTAIDGNLGLVSSTQIVVDGGAGGAIIVAALFAEERLDVRSRVDIAGAIVTNALLIDGFDALSIWYTPRLAALAPFGMPTGGSVANIDVHVVGWFQRR